MVTEFGVTVCISPYKTIGCAEPPALSRSAMVRDFIRRLKSRLISLGNQAAVYRVFVLGPKSDHPQMRITANVQMKTFRKSNTAA